MKSSPFGKTIGTRSPGRMPRSRNTPPQRSVASPSSPCVVRRSPASSAGRSACACAASVSRPARLSTARSALRPLVGLQTRPDALLVEELRQPLLAPALAVEELRLLELGVEVVLGLIPAHRPAVLEAELGRAQHDGILGEQLARELLDLGAPAAARHARVDEPHLGRLAAAERAPGHDVQQRCARAD